MSKGDIICGWSQSAGRHCHNPMRTCRGVHNTVECQRPSTHLVGDDIFHVVPVWRPEVTYCGIEVDDKMSYGHYVPDSVSLCWACRNDERRIQDSKVLTFELGRALRWLGASQYELKDRDGDVDWHRGRLETLVKRVRSQARTDALSSAINTLNELKLKR